jgi:hypothetical protein
MSQHFILVNTWNVQDRSRNTTQITPINALFLIWESTKVSLRII